MPPVSHTETPDRPSEPAGPKAQGEETTRKHAGEPMGNPMPQGPVTSGARAHRGVEEPTLAARLRKSRMGPGAE